MSGFVANGDQVEYAVTLTPQCAFCSCKDAMFRHTVCKRAVALALFAIRNPKSVPQEEPVTTPVMPTLVKTRRGFAFSA